jgi:YD repeat-containing protein
LAAVGPGFTGSYSYDANGNRTAKTENGQAWTYTYGASDRLLSATGPSGTTSYGYDFAGRANLISGPGGNTALAYNADGYVTGITYPNSTVDAFVTNSFGQRVSPTSGCARMRREVARLGGA